MLTNNAGMPKSVLNQNVQLSQDERWTGQENSVHSAIDRGPVSTEKARRTGRHQTQSIIRIHSSIAMVTDDFLPAKTGVGVHVQKVAPELVRQGHHVIVLTSRRPGQPAFESWNGVLIYRFFSLSVAGFSQALPSRSEIVEILTRHHVDVVHFHYLSLMMIRAAHTAKTLGLATVFTAHMTVDVLTQPLFMKPFHGILSWIFRRVINSIDSVVCVSPHQVKDFIASRGSKTVISNPIDFRGDEAQEVARSDEFVVLYVGRLEQKKNVRFLVEGFRKLALCRPHARLQIAGVGVEEQALRRQVKEAGLTNKVSFLGHVPHDKLPALYASCDVFVLPSVLETQGMVVLEAMRFRRPVIVTNKIISARELVEPGINGFIVDADSVDDLTDKLIYFFDHPERRREMGQAGHDRFPVETAATVADKLDHLYNQITQTKTITETRKMGVVDRPSAQGKNVTQVKHGRKVEETWGTYTDGGEGIREMPLYIKLDPKETTMNTKTAILERNAAADSNGVLKLYAERLFTLSDVGQGQRMTEWPVDPPASDGVNGHRMSPWE